MTEETPINPVSKKGLVRSHIVRMVMEETKKGNLQALIARWADLYGPSVRNTSVLSEMVFKNFSKGKKAYWFASVDYQHSFTYTPDAGKATELLGNMPGVYNRVWHLPTAPEPLTGKEWIETIAKEMGWSPNIKLFQNLWCG